MGPAETAHQVLGSPHQGFTIFDSGLFARMLSLPSYSNAVADEEADSVEGTESGVVLVCERVYKEPSNSMDA